MTELITFVVAGLTAGAVYALAAIGLVLTYRTSGVLNFAHGAVAAASAYAFYALNVEHGVPWPLAAACAVLVVGVVLGLLMEMLARRLQTASLAMQVAGTVGVLLTIASIITLIYGTLQVRQVPTFLPHGSVKIAGASVQWSDLTTLVVAAVVTVALSIGLRRSRLGMASRAVVDDAELLDSIGLNPVRVRRVAWIVGTLLATLSGVLFAPLLPLDPVQLTLLVVSAFGAAAIGGFRSLPLTFAGGLAIGVLASIATKYFSKGLLAGTSASMPFLVLFLVLLIAPKRLLTATGVQAHVAGRHTWRAPLRLQAPLAVVVLVILALVPHFAGIRVTDWTTALATTVVFLSLSLLVRTSGQVSLCQVSFTAIGAAAFAHLVVDHHVPWLLALVLAGLIAVPIGAVLAVPAIRLSPLYLALATFGFGILMQYMFYAQSYMFGANGAGVLEPMPQFAGFATDRGYYYLVLAIVVVCVMAVGALERGRLGRLLRAMADSTTTLESTGTAVKITRVLVFCISAFLAAVGGALVAVAQGNASADSYPPLLSLTYLTVIVIITVGYPWNAIIAAYSLILIPAYVTGFTVSTVLQLVFGVSAVLTALMPQQPPRLIQALRAEIDRRWRSTPRMSGPARVSQRPAAIVSSAAAGEGLAVSELQVQFGGLTAVDGVTLTAPVGRITGLIGPNGAGKTTTFNACSGLVRPAAGEVRLHGRNITRVGPDARARRGIGRTFQRMGLFDSLTVRENVALGCEGGLAGQNPLRHLVSRSGDRAAVRVATDRAIDLCNLSEFSDRPVSALSTGQRRLVDLARCLAGSADMLLLDEPTSGLDQVETERLSAILRRTVEERGVGLLLVEHDLSMVLGVCDYIYVLDFGLLVFEGTPSEVLASPLVHAAYLGSHDVERELEKTVSERASA
jgi:ABC-type branched-subunit amino acid transport system ATPase component/branched-subunit amino acid ABC-type transport system permease component